MTVKELIERLQKEDPNLIVVVERKCGYVDEILFYPLYVFKKDDDEEYYHVDFNRKPNALNIV